MTDAIKELLDLIKEEKDEACSSPDFMDEYEVNFIPETPIDKLDLSDWQWASPSPIISNNSRDAFVYILQKPTTTGKETLLSDYVTYYDDITKVNFAA